MKNAAVRPPFPTLRDRLRRTGASIYGIYAWTVFAVVLLCFGSLILLTHRPWLARRLARIATRLMFGLAGMPLHARGLERLPREPHVLLVNHASFLDGIALTALLPPVHAFAVRQEYKAQRLLCPLLGRLGTVIMTDPGRKHRLTNIDRLEAALLRGDSLVVFPEGGFDSKRGLKPFHSGAFVAAVRTGAPLVVAGLRGTRDALHSHSWLPRRVPVVLEIGQALPMPAGKPASVGELRAAARAAISALAGEG